MKVTKQPDKALVLSEPLGDGSFSFNVRIAERVDGVRRQVTFHACTAADAERLADAINDGCVGWAIE